MTESMRHADAIAQGIGRGVLGGPRWRKVSHGLYVRAEAPADMLERCRQLRPVLPPGAAFSHLTGAALWSCWLPRLPSWLPMLATIPPRADRPERSGLYVARSRAALPGAAFVSGVPVLAPELILGQLAEDLPLIDLVVALDCFLQRRLCGIDDIVDGIRSRQRGLPKLRRALSLCDGRSESPWETILRLLHVFAEIPVEPQHLIRVDEGEIAARGDLRIVGTNQLPEYDGATHRTRQRHERDLARDKLLNRHGLVRFAYTASEILHHPGLIVRDAETALGWRHDPDRINAWLVEVERSSLMPLGWRRLLNRLHRFDRPLRGRGARRTPPANCGKVPADTPLGA
ncbi:MAG: hypothetical protein WAK18_11620 [Nocardioidaceae bacterium]